MEKKGVSNVGGIILFAVMIIVAAAFIPAIFSSQTSMTGNYTESAQYTPAAAGSSTYVTGQDLLNTPVVLNESGADINCAGNVTFAEVVRTDTGVKGISMTSVATISSVYCSTLNVSYAYGAEGYVDDSGSRGVAGLIGLFAVLVLLAGAIYYFYREGGLDFLNR
jgi:flagellin-like protein